MVFPLTTYRETAISLPIHGDFGRTYSITLFPEANGRAMTYIYTIRSSFSPNCWSQEHVRMYIHCNVVQLTKLSVDKLLA